MAEHPSDVLRQWIKAMGLEGQVVKVHYPEKLTMGPGPIICINEPSGD